MSIAFKCTSCGRALQAKPEMAGKKTKCPGCATILAIPAGGAAPAARPAPPKTTPAAAPAAADVVTCECGSKIRTKPEWAGKSIKCPKCQSVIKVPGGAAVAAAARPAPKPAPPPIEEDEDPFSGGSISGPADEGFSDFTDEEGDDGEPAPVPARFRKTGREPSEGPDRLHSKMSSEQFKVLVFFGIVLAALILFPPFHNASIIQERSFLFTVVDRQTGFLLNPPSRQMHGGQLATPWTVNWLRLLIEIAAVGVICLLFFFVVKPKKKSRAGLLVVVLMLVPLLAVGGFFGVCWYLKLDPIATISGGGTTTVDSDEVKKAAERMKKIKIVDPTASEDDEDKKPKTPPVVIDDKTKIPDLDPKAKEEDPKNEVKAIPPKAAADPLTYVAADSIGFVNIRPQVLLKTAAVQKAIAGLFEGPQAKEAKDIVDLFGIGPMDVTGVAVAFNETPMLGGNDMPGVYFMSFAKPVQTAGFDKLVEGKTLEKKATPTGLAYYSMPLPPATTRGIALAGDRTLIFGEEPNVVRFLTSQAAKDGPLAGAIKNATDSDACVFVGFQKPAELVEKGLSSLPKEWSEALKPLAQFETCQIAVSADPKIKVKARLQFSSRPEFEGQAGFAKRVVDDLLTVGAKHLADAKKDIPQEFAKYANVGDAALRSVKPSVSGTVLEVPLEIDVTIEEIVDLAMGAMFQGKSKPDPKASSLPLDPNIGKAKADIAQLTLALLQYKLDHPETGFPNQLADLVKKDDLGRGPYVANQKNLSDTWGNFYQYDSAGSKNAGLQPDIWTVIPPQAGGGTIGNWTNQIIK